MSDNERPEPPQPPADGDETWLQPPTEPPPPFDPDYEVITYLERGLGSSDEDRLLRGNVEEAVTDPGRR